MPNFTKILNLEKPLRGEFYSIEKHNENSDKIDLAIEKITVPTIERLKNMIELQEGDIVEVQGYYTAGDGTHHKRKIEATDDGSGVQLVNGLWANIVHNGEVLANCFGIKEMDVNLKIDQSDLFQKVIDYAQGKYVIRFTGEIFLNKKITCKEALNIEGYNGLSFSNNNNDIGRYASGIYTELNGVLFDIIPNDSDRWKETLVKIKKIRLSSDNYNSVFFNMNSGGAPGRYFIAEEVTATSKFGTVFQFTQTGSTHTFNLDIRRCCMVGGEYAIKTIKQSGTDTYLLGNVVVDNNMLEGGARVKMLNCFGSVQFTNNLIENQDNPVEITGIGTCNIKFDGNYFENNTGDVILSGLQPTTTVYFGKQYYWGSSDINIKTGGATVEYKDKILDNLYLSYISEGSSNGIYNLKTNSNLSYFIDRRNARIDKININRIANRLYDNKTDYVHLSDNTKKNILSKSFERPGFNTTKNYILRFNYITNVSNFITVDVFDSSTGDMYATTANPLLTNGEGSFYLKFEIPSLAPSSTRNLIARVGITSGSVGRTFVAKEVYLYEINGDTSDIPIINEFFELITLSELDTPYYCTKMESEGVYGDFVDYIDALHEYEKQQKAFEEQYQQALEYNPELTFEQFLDNHPTTYPMTVEPQPSERLIDFKNKYLG